MEVGDFGEELKKRSKQSKQSVLRERPLVISVGAPVANPLPEVDKGRLVSAQRAQLAELAQQRDAPRDV